MRCKIILFGTLLLLVNNNSFAQKFNAALIAGLNSSQFDGDSYQGYSKPGIITGIGISFPVSKSMDIHYEICYSQKGSKKQEESFLFLLKLNYLETPFYLLYHTPGKFSFYSGISPGILLTQKTGDIYGITESDCFKLLDFEGLIGFGYKIIPRIELNCRLGYSLLNVLKEGCVGVGGFLAGYNNLISTTLRYNLGLNESK